MYKKIHKYLEEVIPERPQILKEMENYAKDNNFHIIGPLVGRYLYMTALSLKARKVLELGSGFGYSAYWFSLAIKGKGKIIMTDSDKKNKKKAFEYFKKGGLQSHFDFKIGDALKVAKKLDGNFDIILNDIDKIYYPDTIDLSASLLKRGGLFITDNIIWSGKVYDKNPDKTTKAIQLFTKKLYNDSRFFTTILPLRDGVSVALRL